MKERKKMIKINVEPKEFIDLYLFGSAVYSQNPTDIDIAVIYKKGNVSINEAIKFRRELESNLTNQIGSSVDIILLSNEEEKEMEFLSNAKHELI